MLGGGVPVGKITEFCGAPGIGKTQIGYVLTLGFSSAKGNALHCWQSFARGGGLLIKVSYRVGFHPRV